MESSIVIPPEIKVSIAKEKCRVSRYVRNFPKSGMCKINESKKSLSGLLFFAIIFREIIDKTIIKIIMKNKINPVILFKK